MSSTWIRDHRPGPLDAVDGLVLTRTATSPREIAMPWQQAAQIYCEWRRIPTAPAEAN